VNKTRPVDGALVLKRLIDSRTALLWLLIIVATVLLGGQAAGVQWTLSTKSALGRLLIHPWVAAIEMLLALALIFLARLNHVNKKWLIPGVATIAIGCALYHWFYYYIGTEILLMYGAGFLMRKNSTQA